MKQPDSKIFFPFRHIFLIVMAVICAGIFVAIFSGCSGEGGKSALEEKATLYSCGMHPWIVEKEPGNCPICGMKLTPKRDDAAAKEQDKERKILYWRAPMNPEEIYEEPGKSAMGMDLVPVYEDELSGGIEIKIDPVTQQNMGIRTAVVEKGQLVHTIRTYGHITYDETRTAQINPKFSGWFEKLYVDFTGQLVEKDQPIFEIYSPELVTAQEEYIGAYRNFRQQGSQGKRLLASARKRLTYFGIAETEIRAIEQSGKAKRTIGIRSPFKGVVTHKNAVEGGYVNAGTTVYQIADLSKVWVEAHIYEYELHRVKSGLEASMTLPYLPGKTYTGKVAYVYPYLQRKTRDVVIRLEFDNPDLELKPDMYTDVRIETTDDREGLLIPSEAVIRSGERNVVFVTRGNGKFSPREITLGIAVDGGKIHVLSGLMAGETVVTSGQFLLDSESKLKEATLKMLEMKKDKPATEKMTDHDHTADAGTGAEDDFFSDME